MFGGTSVEAIRTMLRQAVRDPDVRSIILDVDSPGGGIGGLPELAAELRAARDLKTILAIADTTAASAALWIAAQASALYIVPSGSVGSVGVYGIHYDLSRALEAEGITPTVITSSPLKIEQSEFAPLSDDARGRLQARVDAHARQFVVDVAAGRRVSPGKVLADFGNGLMLLPDEALAAGMVDGIATMDDVLSLAAAAAPPAKPAASSERRPARGRDAYERALAEAGEARELEQLRTTVHEAGHAVVAARVGLVPSSVESFLGHEGLTTCEGDTVDPGTLPSDEWPTAARRWILQLRAGEAAVEVAGLANPAHGSDSDRDRALEVARMFGLADPEHESATAYQRALELLREDAAEPLARLAAALRASGGRLAGPEVLEALRGASRPQRIVAAERAAADAERLAAAVDPVEVRIHWERLMAEARRRGEPMTKKRQAALLAEATEAARSAAHV